MGIQQPTESPLIWQAAFLTGCILSKQSLWSQESISHSASVLWEREEVTSRPPTSDRQSKGAGRLNVFEF